MTDPTADTLTDTLIGDPPLPVADGGDNADAAVRSPELRRGGRRMVIAATKRAGWWIPFGTVASLVWVGAKILMPLAARSAIDTGFDPYDSAEIVKWCGVILALAVFAAAGAGFRWYCAFYVAHRTEHVLRSRLFAHLQELHFGYHDRSQIGNLMARANLDLRQINLLTVFVPVFAANVVMVVAILVVLFTINVKLTLLSLISFPLLAMGAAWFQRLLSPVANRLQERLADVSEVVEEGVAGIRVLKGFGAEQVQKDRLDDRAEQVRREAVALGRLRATFNPMLDLLPMVALVTVLYVGGKDAIAGSLTVGDMVAFSFLLLQLVFPLRMTSYIVSQLSRATASAARVQEVMVTEPRITDDATAPELPAGPGAVSFSGVRFAYRGAADVLRDFDLEIAGGESVALVGTTGCGKSTVARLIPRFYDVDAGSVSIDGHDVRDVRLGSLRREIGLVFEETFLFSDTVWENLAFAAGGSEGDISHERIVRAAELAGADDFIRDLPDGYDTMLGEHGFSLSGGQRQRLAIARAILADPRVLILDDATSAVDPSKEHEIRSALSEVMQGRTTLIIAHRPATIALADRVVLMDDDGRIAATGAHADLLATNARYRQVLADISVHEEHDEVAP
jgi:ATP-binding cassette, subfamily B, bacterial